MRFLSNYKYTILLAIIIIAVVGSLVATAKSCDGTLVRGVIWYECIEDSK